MNDIAIFLCCRTDNPALPWARAGYDCYCVDVQHPVRVPYTVRVGAGRIIKTWGDVRSWTPPAGRIAFMMAFPPCTHLAVSGARDFLKKGGWMLADALQLFDSCMVACEYSRAPYVVENPVGRLSSHRRKPDHIIHPWEYAGYLPDIQTENTQKATCLWTGGGFVLPEKRPAPAPHRQDCWEAPPSLTRADERAVTPMGFAEAVFLANHKMARMEAA
jgi:hypothetical protein